MRASRDADCPWARVSRASLQGDIASPVSELPSVNLVGVLRDMSLTWGEFATDAQRTEIASRWDLSPSSHRGRLTTQVDVTALRLQNAGGPPRSWRASVARTAVRAELGTSEAGVGGPLQVSAEAISGEAGKTKFGGNALGQFAVRTQGDSFRMADLAGVLRLQKVAVATGKHTIENWWADLSVSQARLDVRQNFNLAASVAAHARDGLPALYVLASEDVIPHWIPSLLPLQSLQLDLGINRSCRMTDVRVRDARGGPLEARGGLQVEPGETRGAVLFRLAALPFVAIGLHFVEDYSSTSLFAGSTWLHERTAPLDVSLSQRRAEVCTPEPTKCR